MKTIFRNIIFKSALFLAFLLIAANVSGCGGDGGNGPVTPVTDTSASTEPKSIEITGRIGSTSSAPSSSPGRQSDFQSINSIAVSDENDEKIPGATAVYRGLNSFRVTAPLDTESKYILVAVKNPSGQIIYKNLLGRLPKKSDISASVLKVSGVKINEETTVKSLLVLNDRSKLPQTYIATADTFDKTQFEKDVDAAINDADGTRVITPLTTALKTVLTTPDQSAETARSTFLKSVESLIEAFAKVTKATSSGSSILIGGRIISAQSEITSYDLAEINTKIKSAIRLIAAIPIFSPAGGSYETAPKITISTNTAGATIKYTTDGTNPSQTNGEIYQGDIILSQSATLKAIAIMSGFIDSDVSSATYVITGPAVSPLNLDNITVGSPSQTIGNIYTLAGGQAAQTINTSTPYFEFNFKRADNLSFVIDQPASLKLKIAVTMTKNSSTKSSIFVYNYTPETGEKLFTNEFSALQVTANSIKFNVKETSTLFLENAAYNIAVNALEGVSYTNANSQTYSFTLASNVGGNVTIAGVESKLQPPAITPSGGIYSSTQQVSIIHADALATIKYTIDGSDPGASSGTNYSAPVSITQNTTLKAIALKAGRLDSDIVTSVYYIKAANPVFSPAAGSFESVQNVTVTSLTMGASIYYTEDGSVPTVASTLYSGPISVSSTKTIKAIAIKTGMNSSDIVTAEYVLQAKALTALSVKENSNGSGSELLTGFSGSTSSYSINIPTSLTGVKVAPTAASGTTFKVMLAGVEKANGVLDNLAAGVNTVSVIVSESGKTSRTYSIIITRQELSAGLTALSLTGVSLTPAFSSAVTSYTASVSMNITSTTVKPTADNGAITVNSNQVASGNNSSPIALNFGVNTITIAVSESGKASKTYTITITRQQEAEGLTALVVRDV
ncbi:MAG TPA: chitobiase/beta-hexosaminidase C-terminal domain-containing protein, partial [Candidatus Wallbacteria bacterium]|nr:chitobiase/beta-hexosaminidase C-terminal domain-containing protein [Candidatus Wallbacteria bacterium]